jgi:hypothetical protein
LAEYNVAGARERGRATKYDVGNKRRQRAASGENESMRERERKTKEWWRKKKGQRSVRV